MPKVPSRKSSRRSASSSISSKGATDLSERILQGLHEQADSSTKEWFTNYVKGTVWIGCKTPVVRTVVKETTKDLDTNDHEVLLNEAIRLLQQEACDGKLAGMLLLQENLPLDQLANRVILDRLDAQVLARDHVSDWSSADWFAVRVLQRIVLAGNHELVHRVLDFTKTGQNLWHRRCGVVAFLHYYKHRDKLPKDISSRLIQACEQSLLASPEMRFTQTGIAWVLRYVLLEQDDRDEALEMIVRHERLWNTEAKRSMTEKMRKSDPRRKQILDLGS